MPRIDPNVSPLETPLQALPGVGAARAALLLKLNLVTVGDLLHYAPRRHEDRRHLLNIRQLMIQKPATTRGRIVALGTKHYQQRSKSVFEIILEDGTGRLHCRWWNLPFMERYFAVGDEVMVFGRLRSVKPRVMDHPETEIIESASDEEGTIAEKSVHLDRVVPVYGLTEGLPQRWLRTLVWRVLTQFRNHIVEPRPGLILEDLPGRAEALGWIHFPSDLRETKRARERLALDEFIDLQLAIQRRRKNLEANARGLPCAGDNRLVRPFLRELGFKLTRAQTRVLREMRADLGGAFPMRRLLQGDVGSGKTVVAACCALMAMESGYNVALMVPTEILAAQHYSNFVRWFGPLGISIEMQTGSRKTAGEGPGELSASGDASRLTLFIGTHALLESGFGMENLGLVIIDEQHKFGVTQRETLVRKGRYPHLLVMTATPIPRTLGLTVYGDLDVSAIDELPAGRGRVRTFVRAPGQLARVHEFIKKLLAAGQQAYVVLPRVEEADLRTGKKAVLQEFARLQAVFAPHRVGMLHGRLPAHEKERVMTEFREKRVQVLLATSVIEVGMDVPSATVMLVENAEQFGLAQLHQLRGRIGRGAQESWCILVGESKTDEASERLRVLASTADGFEIAEADLRLRGPGELLGRHQSGAPLLVFGNLAEDGAIVDRARLLAARLLDGPKI
ncbi:MAG: ATP-dependent helicase RecG [Verrucomicrobiota bacterium]|jgi:ATP-dependent DNA helicase RecG